MKLSIATTGLLAVQGFTPGAHLGTDKSSISKALLNTHTQHAHSRSSHAALSDASLRRTPSSRVLVPLTRLKAAEGDFSSVDDAHEEPLDLDEQERSSRDISEESAEHSGADANGVDLDRIVDIMDDLVNKYRGQLEKDVTAYAKNITNDLSNLTDVLIKKIESEASEQVDEINKEIDNVQQLIDTLKKSVDEIYGNITSSMDEVAKWAESTIKFAEDSAPDIIKVNQTRIDEIKTDIQDKMAGPITGLKEIWRIVESFFNPGNATHTDQSDKSSGNSTDSV